MKRIFRDWWPVIAFFLAGVGTISWAYYQDVSRCRADLQHAVSSHEIRLQAIEEWLESNRRLPETMAKIEANTSNMNLRISEILSEIRDLRKQAMERHR